MSELPAPPPPPPPRRPRRRRRLVGVLLLVAALPLAAVAAAWAALHLRAVRQAVLDHVAASVEGATGWRLAAEDFSFAPLSGELELRFLTLTPAGAPRPFLSLPRARAEIALGSLLRGRLLLRSVRLEGPAVDLAVPLPPPAAAPGGTAAPPAVEIRQLEIVDGALRGAPLPEPASWLRGWRLEGITTTGSLADGAATLRLTGARLTAELRDGAPLTARLSGALAGPLAGPYRLSELRLEGSGLDLAASGELGFNPQDPLRLALHLDALPGRVLPAAGEASRLAVEGDLDLRRWSGRLTLDARQLPAELAEPWLGSETLARMGAAGTHLEVTARLAGDDPAGPLTGSAEVVWQRRGEPILTGDAYAELHRDAAGTPDPETLSVELTVAGRELPADLLEPWLGRETLARMGAAGTRFDLEAGVTGTAGDAPLDGRATLTWRRRGAERLLGLSLDGAVPRRPADGRLDLTAATGALQLTAHDLPAELLEPWVGAEPLARFAAAGTRADLEATLRFARSGPAPLTGHADLAWRRGEERLLTATLRAPAGARDLRLEVDASLLPGAPGSRRLVGAVAAPGWQRLPEARLDALRLTLDAPDLAAARAALDAAWPGVIPPLPADLPLTGTLTATAEVNGPFDDPAAEVAADWRPVADASLRLTGSGHPLAAAGEARLEVDDLPLERLAAWTDLPLAGRVSAVAAVERTAESLHGRLTADGAALRFAAEWPTIDRLHLAAESDGTTLTLTALEAAMGEREVSASGSLGLTRPVRRAQLEATLSRPLAGLDRLRLDARLAEGVVHLELPEIVSTAGRGALTAALPWGTLAAVPTLGPRLTGLPVEAAAGPLTLDLDVPRLDAASLLVSLGVEEAPEELAGSLAAHLAIDPRRPTEATGEVQLRQLAVTSEGRRVTAVEPLRLVLAAGRIELPQARLVTDGRSFAVAGEARLRSGWTPEEPLLRLVEHLTVDARGTLPAAHANPYLGGGAASGPVDLEVTASGPPDALTAELHLAGADARLLYLTPYATKIVGPDLRLEVDGGRLRVRSAVATLNEGTLSITGERTPEGRLTLDAAVSGVRYRLDYGLSVVLSGSLQLVLPPEGRGRISGNLLVERGTLRRDMSLDREILSRLFTAAPELLGTEEGAAGQIDLDLSLATLDGVRVKNNLADMKVTWSPLEVRGTLAQPVTEGRLEVEPGGLIFAYGQTVRLDQATLTFPGQPGAEPHLELETTSSLKDQSLAVQQGRLQLPWTVDTGSEGGIPLEEGLKSYYGNVVASRLAQGGPVDVSVRPLVLLGSEVDPTARLNLSRELSDHVSLAVSVGLRQAESQIYLLELHDFRQLPSLSLQLFTDQEQKGTTLQQTFELGGGPPVDEAPPRLHRLRLRTPVGLSARRLRASLGLEEGDPLPEGAAFDLEVDAAEALRRQGYPDAEATVSAEPAAHRRGVDLVVDVEPGPHATYRFEGTAPPRALRPTITSLYRADFFEEAALEEMRQQTVRALRSQGYVEPTVTIEVEGDDPADEASDRTVTIHAEGGRRLALGPPVLHGLEPAVATEVAGRFDDLLERAELAAGEPDADRYLLGSLRSLGYPDARILSRDLSDDGTTLTLRLDPGARQHVATIVVAGVSEEEAGRLAATIALRPGDPARADRIAAGTVAIENDFEHRGYADAEVSAQVEPLSAERPDELVLTYRVEPGPQYRVAEVVVDGTRSTRPAWARRVTGVEPGALLERSALDRGRRRLADLGIFSRVRATSDKGPDGAATVTFDVEERPRFALGYGLRWTSESGAAVVLDAQDDNFLGRGISVAVRALYAAEDRQARLYGRLPHVFGGATSLDLAVGATRDVMGGQVLDRVDASVQLSRPLSERTRLQAYATFEDRRTTLPDLDFTLGVARPVLGLQWLYDSRNDRAAPTRGLLATVDLSGSHEAIGSEVPFLRTFGQLQLYRGIGKTPLTWAQSLRLGAADGLGKTVSRLDRFFAGGEYSVRGYGRESLGPQDPFGVVGATGGTAILVLNEELHFPIWRQIAGVVFYDAGNVWLERSDFGQGLAGAVGLGLRTATPAGLLRIDFAHPLDRRPELDEPELRVYIGLGNAF